MSSGKILVAQGGGPTAVINQSLVGVVLEARRFRNVTRVYGALHGVRGIINEDFVDLTQETSHNLEQVACTPSSALGSTRDKPDAANMAAHAEATFWFVLPSLPMFLLIPAMLRHGCSFWLSLAVGCVLTIALYSLMVWAGPRIGLRL